jgi:hypothetical protein
VFLLAVGLVLPGADFQLFNGLPFESLGEAVAAVVLVPLAASRALRRRLVELAGELHPRTFQFATAAVLLVLGLRVVLLVSGVEEGFRACYGSPAAPLPSGPCERSYSNLFDRYGGATRIDHSISFGGRTAVPAPGLIQSTWNLSFVDDLRYDLPVTPQQPNPRDRPPLTVRWTGRVSVPPGQGIVVTYIGEGDIRVGGQSRALPPSYSAPRQVELPSAGGDRPLTLSYSFRPRKPTDPYAAIRMAYSRGSQLLNGGQLVHAAPPDATWRVLAFLDDALLAVLLALIVVGQGLAIGRRDRVILLTVGAAGWLVLVGWSPWREAVCIALLGIGILLARPKHPLLVAWYAVIFVCSLHPLLTAASLNVVSYRTTGNDWLTYESLARSMLYGSLQGGEAVFYYQPGWRYILFLERAFLGDGDILRTIFAFTTVTLPLIALGFWGLQRRRDVRGVAAVAALIGAALVMVSSPDVRIYLDAGASESITWAIIPLLFAIPMIRPQAAWPWVLGPVAAALTVTIRPNHLPAAVLLIVIYALIVPVVRRRWFVLGAVLAVFVALTPSIHDSIFSHSPHLAVTSSSSSANIDLPPSDLVKVFSDASVRSELGQHVEQILYLGAPPGSYEPTLAIFMLALLASWLVLLVRSLRRWRSIPRYRLLLVLVPVAYLAPHLIFQVATYFPRHLIAGYLAMAAVTVVAITSARPKQETAAREEPAPRQAILADRT